MLIGAHVIIYSKDAEADRNILKEVLHLPYVDAGEGWLIFSLPPSEIAIHPYKRNNVHQIYFMCTDLEEFMAEMKQRSIACDDVVEAEWGLMTYISLPGGGKLGVYQPRHARPSNKSNA